MFFRLIACLAALTSYNLQAQRTVLLHGVIHIGNGKEVQDGAVYFEKGKILYAGPVVGKPQALENDSVIDLAGKHVYPGFIAVNNVTGLNEIDASRPTRDYREIGFFNPEIRSQIAFNTDSKILPTLRFNGVMMTDPTPQGGLVSGTSSLMQTWGKNWEDATVVADHALHVFWPEVSGNASANELKNRDSLVKEIKLFFESMADLYKATGIVHVKALSLKKVFEGQRKIWIHAQEPESIQDAAAFFSKWPIPLVLVGGKNCLSIAEWLATNHIAVVLDNVHSLPSSMDQDVNAPYKLAAAYQAKGVLFGFSMHGSWETRNLAFQAGTAVAWGLKYEVAVSALSLNLAKIIGIDAQYGSLEKGKIATLFISKGDALDPITQSVEYLFYKGISVPVNGFQQEQFQKYKKN